MAKHALNKQAAPRVSGSGKGNQRVSPGDGEDFWNRPALMNLAADMLLLMGGVMLIWAAAMALQRLPFFPLRQVVVATPLAQVSRAQIEYTARAAVNGNFFTINLENAQAAFERLPWVRRADVRRVWPDGIELRIEEHHASARWTPLDGEPRLVNTRGEVFAGSTPLPLPVFSGPEGSAPRILARHQEFVVALAQIGRTPVATRLSAREAWQLKLDDGVLLELGRDQPKHPLIERLSRFTTHYAASRARLQTVGVVDMRYPNGFALRASKS